MAEPDPQDSLDAATRATRSLQGLSTELTARVPQLLEAMRSVGAGLELHSTLDRICETAAELAHARYAAIGVVDELGEGLSDFVTYGVPREVAEAIGRRPDGHRGLLGALIHDPAPVRLADLTTDPRYAGFPSGHPRMRTFLGVPIRVQGDVFGNLYLAEKQDGAEFSDYDLHMVRVLATEAGIAIGNARLYEAARQREHWIDGSVAVTTALLSGGDADEALSVVAEQARRLADSAAGIVLLPAEEGGLEIVAVSSDDPASSLGVIIPPRSAVVAKLLAGEAVFIDDSATDRRMITRLAERFGPSMMLPLHSGGRVLGALATPRARGARPFTETERTLATQFASQAALALMMAEAQRDRERLAVYEDRDRIARDLHDLVIQRLFATGMMLESAQRRSVVPEVRTGVGRAADELDVTIQEIRTAIFALQQEPAEAPSGLRTRVLREINMAAVPLGFKPSHRFLGPVDSLVGELTGKNLVAALREALSNAFRHAGASLIDVVVDATVTLPDGRGAVRLSVADDGVGIPEGGRRSGLRNLARRAESLGGASRIEPGIGEDGGGTTVVWEAPL
ncbi:GAF domain-containing sensor histidine kinase [Streptomyces griseus]|uniref:Two-component system sensor kinase n=1 Tax=Streptomyces griseus subsp. griseus (strain JCM 4626 / CBS 651.72 / NBRC 13350 / KCC S-0626 / ISP 5235) TaxID=455632 RepID=B1VP93_STRGG|nr:GAF domain-containing protein [Streptomyces griseus]BAG20472.1 putative two-component system sensor kinase [Streptomyces griseus subsp. griseus NBRC 13350]SEE79089.1 Histidine kinase-, DNA gyrase B-, and HSP90-like ATPase [Streptomyces griseus]SQA23287.1 GAF sensor signal transduction histidine kinase [Streptomyces griseus]